MNQAGLVLLANGAVRQMLGLAPDAVAGRPLLEVVDYGPLRELFVKGKPGISELPLPDGRIAQANSCGEHRRYGHDVHARAAGGSGLTRRRRQPR